MLKMNKPSIISNGSENGLFVALKPIERFNEKKYLELAIKAIEHYQTHPNQVPHEASSRLKAFNTPATAVIVGTGTVGLEAIVYASRILPLHATILVLQNDVEDIAKLENIFTTIIEGGKNFNWLISSPTDLGRIDKIKEFLTDHKEYLAHTQLFIHTADKAKRHVPDSLNYEEVIVQVLRRASIPVIEELIELYSNPINPYIRILFSSICSMNRDKYRLPNIGPYQIGKVVGDEFFKSAPVRNNSYSFILYAGGMFTMGETLTRNEEYKLLKNSECTSKKLSEQAYHKQWSKAGTHVDSMDSSGLMFKEIWYALQQDKLAIGKLYSIYGSSVSKELGYDLNTLKIMEPAPYLFDLLEKDL